MGASAAATGSVGMPPCSRWTGSATRLCTRRHSRTSPSAARRSPPCRTSRASPLRAPLPFPLHLDSIADGRRAGVCSSRGTRCLRSSPRRRSRSSSRWSRASSCTLSREDALYNTSRTLLHMNEFASDGVRHGQMQMGARDNSHYFSGA